MPEQLPSAIVEVTGRHWVRLSGEALVVECDDDRSRLLHARKTHLLLKRDGDERVVLLGDRVCVRFGATTMVDPLTAFEARFLVDNGVPLPMPAALPDGFLPRTDLHTHFAAALTGAALVELAVSAGLPLDRERLLDAGIDVVGGTPPRRNSC